MYMVHLRNFGTTCTAGLRHLRDLTTRERDFLIAEMSQISGLMPLLMRRRNHGEWSSEDKAERRLHLRRLKAIAPYLALTVAPGSFLALPVLAWWLDRRRRCRAQAAATAAVPDRPDSAA
jgi:hypothetical protein